MRCHRPSWFLVGNQVRGLSEQEHGHVQEHDQAREHVHGTGPPRTTRQGPPAREVRQPCSSRTTAAPTARGSAARGLERWSREVLALTTAPAGSVRGSGFGGQAGRSTAPARGSCAQSVMRARRPALPVSGPLAHGLRGRPEGPRSHSAARSPTESDGLPKVRAPRERAARRRSAPTSLRPAFPVSGPLARPGRGRAPRAGRTPGRRSDTGGGTGRAWAAVARP